MTSRDFCQWLQGWMELRDESPVTKNQMNIIQKHLSMVFAYEIDPSFGNKQKELNNIHQGPIRGCSGIEVDALPRPKQSFNIPDTNPATNPLADESRTWDSVSVKNSDIEYMC